jgi:hypothetical protein
MTLPGWLVRGAMYIMSHAGDNANESCWRWRCLGDMAVERCRCRVMLATLLPSHTGDDAAEATWSRCDIDTESYWWQSYQSDLAAARCRCWVMLTIMLWSHARDSATGATWPSVMSMPSHASDNAAESCWRWHCRGNWIAKLCRGRVMLFPMPPSHAGDGAIGATWPRRDVDVETCWR